MSVLRIAMLHLKPALGALARNAALVADGVKQAAAMGATFVVTPELCLTGYDFTPSIGADWIAAPEDDSHIAQFRALAARLGINLFLAHAERDCETGKCHNTLFTIGDDGAILGKHRKIVTLPGAEGWSTRGDAAAPIAVKGVSVGLLICADAYYPRAADSHAAAGAEILISSANWAPKPHGPEGSWERRSQETGLPIFVCNRTGMDRSLDFTPAETTIAHRGHRLLAYQASHSSLVLVDWDRERKSMARHSIVALESASP